MMSRPVGLGWRSTIGLMMVVGVRIVKGVDEIEVWDEVEAWTPEQRDAVWEALMAMGRDLVFQRVALSTYRYEATDLGVVYRNVGGRWEPETDAD